MILNLSGGNTGAGNIRYVNDESDVNFDWIQVKDANGDWINILRAYTQRYELYMNHNNNAEFKSSAITGLTGGYVCYEPTIAQTEDGLQMSFGNKPTGQYACGCVISKSIDLSRFKTLKFYHNSYGNTSGGASGETYAYLFISNSDKTGFSTLVRHDLFKLTTNNNQSGEVTIDISSLSGECYIGFELHAFGQNFAYVTIDDMYME